MRGLSELAGARGMAAAAVLALAGVPAFGVIYPDATGENHDGNAHMDISSVEVTNDATSISFKINVSAASITSPDWGKYLIGLDTTAGGNSNMDDTGNGWSRSISMNGMDYWVGSWVNSGGGVQLFQWNSGTNSWGSPIGSPTHLIAGNSTTLTLPLADLGLSDGSVLNFDVYTSGGGNGDGANDASSNPLQASPGWPDHYHSTVVSTYTVPEPATAGMLALGGLALLARRRGRA